MIQGLAAIPYVGAVALGKALGVATAGLTAMEISNAITKKIQENPEIINTPQFKGLAFAMGLRIPGVIAPDADEMEKVRQDIEKNLKPGETEPPKIDLTEEFPLPEEELLPRLPGFGEGEKPDVPLTTGGSEVPEQINIPIITYSKGSPKDLKDLVDRSVGQEKGEKAIERIYNDDIFEGVLDKDQLRRMQQLEENYTGGLADLGDAGIPLILENNLLDQHEEFMEDYKDALANAARETLGNEFKAYRLMEKNDAINMLTKGEFPNIKRLQEDEDGNAVYEDLIIDMFGDKSPMPREAFSFSLSPKEALSFRFLSAGGRGDKKDEDFVLIEMKANPTDIIMRGHESEKDLVLRVDGEVAGSEYVTPKLFNVYDVSFGDGNKVELSENELFKNFVEQSKQTTKRGIGDNNPPSPIEDTDTPSSLAKENLNKKLLKETDADDKRAIEYLIELDDFYAKSVKERNEENPQLKNLPKLVEADKHFGAAANSFEGFENSQLIYMSPEEYLDLTKRFRPEKQSKLSKINSDYLTDLLKEGKELANYPYLYVKKLGDSYSVDGQEGIHRAIALKNMGYEEIPVVIQGIGKDADTGIENKVFTATPRSYLYNESWTQEHIGFVPRTIYSKGADDIFIVNPKDIREVRNKKQLFAEGYPFDRTKKADGGIVELLNL